MCDREPQTQDPPAHVGTAASEEDEESQYAAVEVQSSLLAQVARVGTAPLPSSSANDPLPKKSFSKPKMDISNRDGLPMTASVSSSPYSSIVSPSTTSPPLWAPYPFPPTCTNGCPL